MSIAAQAARNLGGFVPNKIFVGGVPITVTEEQFKQCFSTYGGITKVELHALRGFGYITYETVEAVDACLEKYEEHYLCKKWVEVKRSIPRELIEAYEREQRRLHNESAASSSPTKPMNKDTATPKTSAPSGAPGGGKGVPPAANRPPGSGPPQAAPAKAPGRPSIGSIQRTTTSSSIASSQGLGGGATPAIAQLKEMGFSEEVSRRVLNECAWDVNKAIDQLLLTEVPEGADGMDESIDDRGGGQQPGADVVAESEPPHGDANGKSGGYFQGDKAPPATDTGTAWTGSHAAAENGGSAAPAAVSATNEAVASSGRDGPNPPAQSDVQPPAPKKTLERVTKPWTAGDASQLGVVADEFVYVWTETGTDVGWIHAELASNQAKVGWLPQCILQELPDGQRWMRAKQKWQARDETQCSVEVGEFCLVWVSSLTKEGWTYVECQDSADKGWLPDFCLVWTGSS